MYLTYHIVGLIMLILAPLIGGSITSFFKNDEFLNHFLNSFAGGIILGAALLHFFSDATHGITALPDYPLAYLISGLVIYFLYLIANFIPLLVEITLISYSNVSKNGQLFDRKTVSAVAFACCLFIHGVFEGLVVGSLNGGSSSWIIIGTLFVHKIVEFSALTSVLLLTKLSTIELWATLIICEIPCLIGYFVTWYSEAGDSDSDGIFAALSAGTFLYLSLGHLIPESLDQDHHLCPHNNSIEENNNIATGTNDKVQQQLENPTIDHDLELHEPTNTTTILDNNQLKYVTIENNDVNNKDSLVSSLQSKLYLKLRAFIGIGLGFTVFALLALAPEEHHH